LNGEQDTPSGIDVLIEFYEYFSSPELNGQLIGWISEELGINKTVSRLIVSKIAPWVLARAKKAGKNVGAEWMTKFHDRLADRFGIYRWMTKDLVAVLSARVHEDKAQQKYLEKRRNSVADAMQNPDNAALLLDNQVKWEALGEDQKGLVALRAGQGKLANALTELKALLQPQLRLDMPQQAPEHVTHAAVLSFRNRRVEFVGRDQELESLCNFIDSPDAFKWWCITGIAGIGKSRLALEFLVQNVPAYWNMGFLSKDLLKRFDFYTWVPDAPTIIVIDDVATYQQHISAMLDALVPKSETLLFPVRVILLEREYKDNSWWRTVIASGSIEQEKRLALLHTGIPGELNSLKPQAQMQLLQSFVKNSISKENPPPSDEALLKLMEGMNDRGRPLYLGLAALSLVCGIKMQGRNQNLPNLLSSIYEHEMAAWQRLCPDDAIRKAAKNLVAVATACRGLNLDELEDRHYQGLENAGVFLPGLAQEDVWEAAFLLTGGNPGYILEPDLIGEFFLTRMWPHPRHPGAAKALQQKIEAAWEIYSGGMVLTMDRVMEDISESDAPAGWIRILTRLSTDSGMDRAILAMHLFTFLQKQGRRNLEILPEIFNTCRRLVEEDDGDVYMGAGQYLSIALESLYDIFSEQKLWDDAANTFRLLVDFADKSGDWRILSDLVSVASKLFFNGQDTGREADVVMGFKVVMNIVNYLIESIKSDGYDDFYDLEISSILKKVVYIRAFFLTTPGFDFTREAANDTIKFLENMSKFASDISSGQSVQLAILNSMLQTCLSAQEAEFEEEAEQAFTYFWRHSEKYQDDLGMVELREDVIELAQIYGLE
jgi:hypothetical protein